MMAGIVPNRLPYANPSNIVAVHNALTVEMLRTRIWEIMKSDDTMHRQYAHGTTWRPGVIWDDLSLGTVVSEHVCWRDGQLWSTDRCSFAIRSHHVEHPCEWCYLKNPVPGHPVKYLWCVSLTPARRELDSAIAFIGFFRPPLLLFHQALFHYVSSRSIGHVQVSRDIRYDHDLHASGKFY